MSFIRRSPPTSAASSRQDRHDFAITRIRSARTKAVKRLVALISLVAVLGACGGSGPSQNDAAPRPTWLDSTDIVPASWSAIDPVPEWALIPSASTVPAGPDSPAFPEPGEPVADGIYRMAGLYNDDTPDQPDSTTLYRFNDLEWTPFDTTLVLDASTRVIVTTRSCSVQPYDQSWITDWPTFLSTMKQFADATRQWSTSLADAFGIEPYTQAVSLDYVQSASVAVSGYKASDCLERVAWSPPVSDGSQTTPWFFPVQTWPAESELVRVWQSAVSATALEVSAGLYTIYFDAIYMPFLSMTE